jgi:hypothetical protein
MVPAKFFFEEDAAGGTRAAGSGAANSINVEFEPGSAGALPAATGTCALPLGASSTAPHCPQ